MSVVDPVQVYAVVAVPARARARLEHALVSTRAGARRSAGGRHLGIARNLLGAAQGLEDELAALRGGPAVETEAEVGVGSGVCVVCGCTQDRACPGGCWWVASAAGADVCSACSPEGGSFSYVPGAVDTPPAPGTEHLHVDATAEGGSGPARTSKDR